jgi:hypothetical protein
LRALEREEADAAGHGRGLGRAPADPGRDVDRGAAGRLEQLQLVGQVLAGG